MSSTRWLDKKHLPTEVEYTTGLGSQLESWNAIRTALHTSYGLEGDMAWGGLKYGWLLHYRAAGRTLCDLYPEQNAFTALLILGEEERTRMVAIFSQFSPAMQALIDATPTYHDGLWLWIHIPEATATDILTLLAIKRRPSKPREIPRGFP